MEIDSDDKEIDSKLLVGMVYRINHVGFLRHRVGQATPEDSVASYREIPSNQARILGNGCRCQCWDNLNNNGSAEGV